MWCIHRIWPKIEDAQASSGFSPLWVLVFHFWFGAGRNLRWGRKSFAVWRALLIIWRWTLWCLFKRRTCSRQILIIWLCTCSRQTLTTWLCIRSRQILNGHGPFLVLVLLATPLAVSLFVDPLVSCRNYASKDSWIFGCTVMDLWLDLTYRAIPCGGTSHAFARKEISTNLTSGTASHPSSGAAGVSIYIANV